jgi:hypothetical protein
MRWTDSSVGWEIFFAIGYLIILTILYALLGSLGKLWIAIMASILLNNIYNIYRVFTDNLSVLSFVLQGIVNVGYFMAAYAEYTGRGSLTNMARNRYARVLQK